MTRWTMKAVAAAVAVGGLTGLVGKTLAAEPVARGACPDGGCQTGGCPTCPGGAAGGGSCLNNLYDPCWPQRYSYVARQEVLNPFALQVRNSEIIESTVWNRFFVPETDTLNAAGVERLDYLLRRRPAPDARLFLQTARDVAYDPARPDKLVSDRLQLNEKRAQAVQRYLAAQTAARPMNFEVTVIDPSEPALPAIYPANSIRGLVGQYRSGISGGGGGGGFGAAGGAGAAAVPTTGGAPR